MKTLSLFLLLMLSSYSAHAYEVKNVCAKYMTNYSWSKPYQVQTQIFKGDELNRATGNAYFGNYDMFSHYAVIWWERGQASIIKLDFYLAGSMLIDSSGIDQNGRQWKLSDNRINYCF